MSRLGTFLRGGAPKPNAAPAPLRITLARRLVETQGAPFVESREVFGDVASALDELGLLPAAHGPTVVRVQVEGGTADERFRLAGDWLVDPDEGDRVARLPKPPWLSEEAAKTWPRELPWLEAWETCMDGRWMLRAAEVAGVERPLLVLAACACARTALRFVPGGEERPLRAIEAAERWTRGEATSDEARSAAEAAWAANHAATAAADVAIDDAAADVADAAFSAAAAAAWAASSATEAALPAARNATDYIPVAAARAAFAAAEAASVYDAAQAETQARLAELVRGAIPTLVVLRAVATPA